MTDDNYKDLYRQALSEGRNRNYRKALRNLQIVVAGTDTIPQAQLYLGRTYHALGDYKRAIQAYKNFISLSPDESAGYFFLGRTYLSLGFPEYAVYYLKQALNLEKNEPLIYGVIGLAYLRSKKHEAALRIFEKAVQKFPQEKQLYIGYLNTLTVQAIKLFQRGDYDLSGQMFEFVEQQGNNSILTQVYLAMIERERGNYEGSLSYFDKAISSSPHDNLLKLSRANLLFLMGRREAARREFELLKRFYPSLENIESDSVDMSRFLAVQFFQKNEYRKSIFYAKRVLHLEKEPDMHMLLGESFRILGETEKAENHFNRVLSLSKQSIEARYGKIMIFWQKKEYEKILHEIDRIDALNPGNSITSYYRVLCNSRLNRVSNSFLNEVIEEIRKKGPDIHLFTILGDEYLKNGYQDLAEKWFQKTLTLDAENRDALYGLIRTNILLNNHEKIIEAYKRYLEIYSSDHRIRRNFIDFCVEKKKYQTAIDEILAYIPYKKQDEKLQRLLAFCYRKTSEYREAAIIYRNLLRKNLENEEYLRGLVFCLDKMGDTVMAVDLLTKAFHFIKPSASLLLIQGVLLYNTGDAENALKNFRKVLEADDKNWRAYKNIGIIYRDKGVESMANKFFSHAEKYR